MKRILVMVSVVLAVGGLAGGAILYKEFKRIDSDDPAVWDDVISGLEEKTAAENPPEDAVLFVGSSSIRFWETLKQDMAPIPVIQHGFGGSKIYDVVFYADRLITNWAPEKVVIFVGSNDINGNDENHLAPAIIGEQLKALLGIIFSELPDTEVFYIAITPTLFSWDKWESVQEANRMAEAICGEFENATFIETDDLFLNEKGEPIKELFVFDGLHLNEAGYAKWTARIKPYLLKEKL